MAKLDVAYAKPPRIKPLNDASEWHEVNAYQLESVEYIIAVEEFAEVEIPGLQPLTRGEFREICDTRKTRPGILKALSGKTD